MLRQIDSTTPPRCCAPDIVLLAALSPPLAGTRAGPDRNQASYFRTDGLAWYEVSGFVAQRCPVGLQDSLTVFTAMEQWCLLECQYRVGGRRVAELPSASSRE